MKMTSWAATSSRSPFSAGRAWGSFISAELRDRLSFQSRSAAVYACRGAISRSVPPVASAIVRAARAVVPVAEKYTTKGLLSFPMLFSPLSFCAQAARHMAITAANVKMILFMNRLFSVTAIFNMSSTKTRRDAARHVSCQSGVAFPSFPAAKLRQKAESRCIHKRAKPTNFTEIAAPPAGRGEKRAAIPSQRGFGARIAPRYLPSEDLGQESRRDTFSAKFWGKNRTIPNIFSPTGIRHPAIFRIFAYDKGGKRTLPPSMNHKAKKI